jgi:hypothetical protein
LGIKSKNWGRTGRMSNENLDKGINTRFKPGHPGMGGRKPSRLKKFIKEYDVSMQDVSILLTNLIFNYSLDELKEIGKKFSGKTGEKNDLPAGVAAFISGILHDVGRGDMRAISVILDRIYGKAIQSMDIKTSGDLALTTMTPEERKKRIEELLNKGKNEPQPND